MREDLNARMNTGSVCVTANKDEQKIRGSSVQPIKKSKAGNQSLKTIR